MKILLLVIAALSFSCSTSQKEEVNKVEDMYSPAGLNSEEPTFFQTKEGTGLTWLEKTGEVVSFKYANYKNSNWTEPKTLVSGEQILANWADFPGIQTNGNHWIAWFLQMNNPDFFAYDVMIMQSSDRGESWTKPQKLHSDSTLTEHGFVSAVPADNGFQLIWLDGRLATEQSPIFTIRTAQVDFEGKVSNRSVLDNNTCTCCQTTMLNTGNDNFIALYRDRTEAEIRDIAAVTYNNSEKLDQPKIIYADQWNIAGCPVNGPRAIMNGEELGVVWFTMGKDGVAKVKFSTSIDNGQTYSEPLIIDKKNLGRVDLLAFDGAYYVSYMDEVKGGSEIKIAKVQDNKINDTYTIAQVSNSRKTGFPRMALTAYDVGIYITYTNVETTKIELKFMPF